MNMRIGSTLCKTLLQIAVTGVLAAGVVAVAVPAAAQSRSLQDGVYTAAQAKRGQDVFNTWGRCSVCHLENLEGDPQRNAFPLVGGSGGFLNRWNGKTVHALATLTRLKMPQGLRGGGTLTEQQVVDLLAYIFQKNGLPAGEQELSPDGQQLERIQIVQGK